MAEEALKKLEKQLNCPICLDTYTDPKQLNCHHVYCQQCLVRLIIRDRQGRLVLTCPNCRQVTPVPDSGVAGLQAAFQINQLLEIVEEHKKTKDTTTSAESGTKSSNIRIRCLQHDRRKTTLYCKTCEEAICYKCTKKGEKHNNHDYAEFDEAFEKYEEKITSSLEPMEKQLVIINRALLLLDARREEITNQQATMEANIHKTIERLHQTLDVRKTELIGQLHQLTQAKLKSLAVQRDQLETTQARLSSCLHFMRENLKSGNQGEALTTVRQVKELTTTFQPDMLEPNTEADMIFSALEDITAVIQNYGQVHEQGPPDPSKCTATGKGMEVAVVGEKSTALLQILSADNHPSKAAKSSIMCELVSELTDTTVEGSIEGRGQNQYQISYQPTAKGRHQLHIKVEGQHIRGSPFPVAARLPVEKLGTPIRTISWVRGPWGIAVNQRGEVLVTEMDEDCVCVFSPSGKKLQTFGEHGSGEGQFDCPLGVTVDGQGCILVTDYNNHRIQKFTSEGDFLTAVGTEGCGPLKFKHPCGIAYNPINDKIYVGDENDRIQILNSDLSFAFGKVGCGKGEFSNTQHIACDSAGNIYVADHFCNCIKVFTSDGKFLRLFNKCGSELNNNLWLPLGVAIDSNDRVYVSEYKKHHINVYTSDGQFLTSFGQYGRRGGEFRRPTGLAVDSSGVLYVCDSNNCRVVMF